MCFLESELGRNLLNLD